jgi:hypothetical protein
VKQQLHDNSTLLLFRWLGGALPLSNATCVVWQ